MPKRSSSAATSSATPVRRQKHAKTSADQPLISHFFSLDVPGKTPIAKEVVNGLPGTSGSSFELGSTEVKKIPEVIDVDLLEDSDVGGNPENLITCSSPAMGAEVHLLELSSVKTFPSSSSTEPFAYDDLTQDPILYTPPFQPWRLSSLPYSFLAHALVSLTHTRSRIAINNILTNALRTIILRDPTSLLPAIYLLSNTLAPPYMAVELGLGPSIISRSIQHISGLTRPALRRLYNKTGDVGDVAFAAKSNMRTLLPHPPLLVKIVYTSLLSIAHSRGSGAAKQKQKIVEKLLLSATGEEVRFLTRTLSQNLRVGAVRASILTALSRAMVLIPVSHFNHDNMYSSFHISSGLLSKIQPLSTKKGKSVDSAREEILAMFTEAEGLVKRIYVQHPNYEHIVTALLRGLDGLEERVYLTIGVPLHPTLGSPMRSLDEIYLLSGDRPFMAEFKYDGQRAQIHAEIVDGKTVVNIFSRHLEDMTGKYPDVISLVNSIFETHPETTSFIIDTEIVAIDGDGNLKSFQELSNRPRKDVPLQDIQIRVCVFTFDIMYLNGEILLGRPLRERRALLHSRLPPFTSANHMVARFDHVESCASERGRPAIEAFWEKAIQSRCEGLMVKLLDNEPITEGKSRRKQLPATYEPDKRTSAWLKLKKDYVTGLGDTLDLIPIGAWHGNGRKAQWWSPILLGLWEPKSGRVVAMCKCMSGFSDVFYKGLAERYQLSETSETCSAKPIWECDFGGLRPKVYFKPQEVWEIRGADVTLSPVSIAAKGLVSDSRGLSLRFPRFLRVRADKNVEEASTPQFLANMWRNQEDRGEVQGGADEGELVDFDYEAMGDLSDSDLGDLE